MHATPRILFIEDDVELARLISRHLETNGFHCTLRHRGDEALSNLLALEPDLILLDIMLPGKDGLTLCRELREVFHGPIVLLTALDSELNEVVGLETGANDYIVKTSPPSVLLARLRTQMRQVRPAMPKLQRDSEHLRLGGLVIDHRNRGVTLFGDPVPLTTSEFELLWALAQKAGHIVSRDDLSLAIRGIPYDGLDRTVDITLSRLRKKLGDDAEHPTKIKTIRAKGYLLTENAWMQP